MHDEEEASFDYTSWLEPKLAYIQMFKDEVEEWLKLIPEKHIQPAADGREEDSVSVFSNTSRGSSVRSGESSAYAQVKAAAETAALLARKATLELKYELHKVETELKAAKRNWLEIEIAVTITKMEAYDFDTTDYFLK